MHRDLKPANIIVFYDKGDETNWDAFVAKIGDVGLSRAVAVVTDAARARATLGVGTPYYMVCTQA